VNLPRGLKLTINRWATMLEAKIDMCLEEGQDGQCGNFNDNVTDDSEEQVMTRIGQKLLPHECMIEHFSEHTKLIHTIPDHASKKVVPETHYAANASEMELATRLPNENHIEASTGTAPECRDWCETHMDDWNKKCAWGSQFCGACEACASNQAPNPPEEQHIKAVPECRDWCATHMDSWDKKCAWGSLVCSTCEACATKPETYNTKNASKIEFATPDASEEKRVEASMEAVPGCRDWCGWALDTWDKKCEWPSLVCSTCGECVKDN